MITRWGGTAASPTASISAVPPPTVDYDTAITGLFRVMYRMPDGLTPTQFKQGMRRVWIVQTVSLFLFAGFEWFASYMRSLG